ncbi:MAG TPA: hypothetical protein VN903_20910 [Polyangia bacterium]|jgi:hypothetical protein|nr:hypothetical protein [Polyangia bacterium]
MFAAAVLASLLAQAEQAPAPAPPAEASAPATTATPAPAATPAPTPAAPPPAPSPVVAEPAPAPANSASVHVRYAYRIDSGGDSVVPASGLSLGGEFERRVHGFASGIEIGVAANFFYDRFSKDVIATSIDPVTGSTDMTIVTRTLSQTSFAAMETTAWRYADMRFFLGIGGGLTVGYFGSVEAMSSSHTDLLPIARGVFGFDFAVAPRTAAILRVDYTHTFNRDSFSVDATGAQHPLFGDLFDAGIGFLVRF